ncbi:MAG: CDP-diacylglycerol---glycerol-3-phosphate 3-phosphatidyltransferase [Actinomycetota bacterium]|jgi:CDP-diacylglycerol--glycerol-3-phosphate 3-phosphatidyltransferase|nr:CDP-diacylglycerol---glycerol-3-phosphate 3-phosphatidyltransferase [Actinomycetota bacterium]
MLDQKIRDGWDRVVRPVGRAIGKSGLSANAVTTLGLVLQAVVGWAILDGRLVLAGLIAIVAALADGLDGAVAKAKGTVSSFGALFDSTSDRLGDALYFVPIAWLYGVAPDVARHDEPWVAAVALATLVASFLVSYVRARAEGLGFDCKVGIAERAERVILLIIGLVFDILPIVLVVLGVLSVITFVQRMVHVRAQAR